MMNDDDDDDDDDDYNYDDYDQETSAKKLTDRGGRTAIVAAGPAAAEKDVQDGREDKTGADVTSKGEEDERRNTNILKKMMKMVVKKIKKTR